MYDDIVVAPYVEGRPFGTFLLQPNLPEFFVPQDLFLGRSSIPAIDLISWLEDRVFPPNRVGVKSLLRKMGLKKYDYFDVALCTRACLVEDGFWLKVNDTDTFRQCTIRGRMGYPDVDLSLYS